MTTKQVIVMRKDLNMRKGKMCAQAAHASMAFITRRLTRQWDQGWVDMLITPLTDVQREWLNNSFTKICVGVDSWPELWAIDMAAKEAGITCHLIQDNGITEFNGIPTYTCLALGPDLAERLDPLTGHLRLL